MRKLLRFLEIQVSVGYFIPCNKTPFIPRDENSLSGDPGKLNIMILLLLCSFLFPNFKEVMAPRK